MGAAGAGREGGAAPQGFRIIEQPEALVIAREKGWLVRQGTPLGGAIELQPPGQRHSSLLRHRESVGRGQFEHRRVLARRNGGPFA